MTAQQLTDIDDRDAIVAALEDNFAQKIAFFPRQHPEMHVHQQGDVRFVDSGMRSDTFNCAFGGAFTRADSEGTAAAVLRYYRDRGLPMAWWVGPSSDPVARRAVLERVGFVLNEAETGMAALLRDAAQEVRAPRELQVVPVRTAQQLRDFGSVLASVFEPFDHEVERFYGRVSPPREAAASQARLFVGYVHGAPAAIGGAFISGRIAGIYDIATGPAFRRRGYGTVMTSVALQAARDAGHAVVGLQASSDGLKIYKRLGFREVGAFHVYGIAP